MGICGTGMGALAGMLKAAGFAVTGSDANVYPPMSDFLAASGIPVANGYQGANLQPRPDLVIVGNVIRRTNPEAEELAALGIPYLSFPQALAHFFLHGKTPLVVTGTHGKTTTASLLATMLHEAGLSPGFLIGGLVQAFGRNFNLGESPYFVIEGDEYDTAFFDKGPKFLHYRPQIAIITSVEFDHADIYADLEAVKNSFRRLVAIMPPDGYLVAHGDDPVVRELVAAAPCQVLTYGQSGNCDLQLREITAEGRTSHFSVYYQGNFFGRFQLPMPGLHNCLNATAVTGVLQRIGLDSESIASCLPRFQGVKRRQEVRGEVGGITVIDDFAHHPTAVRETLAALKAAYPGRRLVTVFEPRTNSSRRSVFQRDYVVAFDAADRILIKDPAPLAELAEQERFSTALLAEDLRHRRLHARNFAGTDEILATLATEATAGDVIAILSNGGFDNIHPRLLELLAARRG